MFIDWEKKMRKSVRWVLASGAAIAAALAPVPAFTQQQPVQAHELTGFWLTTPHPELAIPPGKTETIPLTLRNANLPPQRAELEVSGVPNDWKWSLKGGNREVNAVIVSPNATEEVKLELTPPAAATGKNAAIDVKARYGSETADLPLTVKLEIVTLMPKAYPVAAKWYNQMPLRRLPRAYRKIMSALIEKRVS